MVGKNRREKIHPGHAICGWTQKWVQGLGKKTMKQEWLSYCTASWLFHFKSMSFPFWEFIFGVFFWIRFKSKTKDKCGSFVRGAEIIKIQRAAKIVTTEASEAVSGYLHFLLHERRLRRGPSSWVHVLNARYRIALSRRNRHLYSVILVVFLRCHCGA